MSKMVKCKACNADVDASVKICHSCGAKIKKPIYKKWWFWVLIVVGIIVVGASGGNNEKSNSEKTSSTKEVNQAIEYTSYSVSELNLNLGITYELI